MKFTNNLIIWVTMTGTMLYTLYSEYLVRFPKCKTNTWRVKNVWYPQNIFYMGFQIKYDLVPLALCWLCCCLSTVVLCGITFWKQSFFDCHFELASSIWCINPCIKNSYSCAVAVVSDHQFVLALSSSKLYICMYNEQQVYRGYCFALLWLLSSL